MEPALLALGSRPFPPEPSYCRQPLPGPVRLLVPSRPVLPQVEGLRLRETWTRLQGRTSS